MLKNAFMNGTMDPQQWVNCTNVMSFLIHAKPISNIVLIISLDELLNFDLLKTESLMDR